MNERIRNLFILQYPLDRNHGFGQKDLKLFFITTHWTKIAVWSKKSETFFFHYPTDMSIRFGQKDLKLFSLQYPLDKNHRFGQKNRKLFLFPLPTGQKEPF